MKLRTGMYHYAPRGSVFQIYRCDYADEHEHCSSPTNESFHTRAEASRRVYELNGWKPKTTANEHTTKASPAR